MQYHFISENNGEFSVEELCEALGLARGGYYAWRGREPSERAREDEVLKERIDQLYEKSRKRYGYRPIYHHLQDEGYGCGRDRTLRLMREGGLEGLQKKRYKPQGTDSNHQYGYSPNLLRELGDPDRPDQVWVADTTYLRTEEGWMYLATVMDLFSRRIVGWSLSDHNDAELVCRALRAGIMTRGGSIPAGLIHHSDRGSTYASYEYERLLRSFAIKQSMSAKGNCYDNAAMESFYGRYKTSSVRSRTFLNEEEVRANVFEYIEVFYNRFRKHASLGYKSPMEIEEKFLPPMGGNQPSLPACLSNN